MSLIIRGVDMPYCCVVCPFKEMYNDGLLCKATKPHQYIPKFLHKRNEKCPLTGLPTPHGRLIDADRLLVLIESECNDNCKGCEDGCCAEDRFDIILSAVKNAPTIIEAEGVNE